MDVVMYGGVGRARDRCIGHGRGDGCGLVVTPNYVTVGVIAQCLAVGFMWGRRCRRG